eukprot:m.334800 g.334800  ORF g.334800 m.334800 type:complete len:107 (+) comp16529_c0_seq24:2057-2377(+)
MRPVEPSLACDLGVGDLAFRKLVVSVPTQLPTAAAVAQLATPAIRIFGTLDAHKDNRVVCIQQHNLPFFCFFFGTTDPCFSSGSAFLFGLLYSQKSHTHHAESANC